MACTRQAGWGKDPRAALRHPKIHASDSMRTSHDSSHRHKEGTQVKPGTLESAKYVMLVTTFPENAFTAQAVLPWDRIRWQGELVFNRFKSLAQLGHLPKYDDESATAWLYGQLLVALRIEKLSVQAESISPWGYGLAESPAPQCGA